MSTRLLLVMFTLTGSLIMMAGPVRAEQDTAFYLAANSALENTERNVRDKDSTTLISGFGLTSPGKETD